MLILFATSLSFGQAPKPAVSAPSSDVYLGFMANIPTNVTGNTTGTLGGFELAYTLSIFGRVGLTASGGETISISPSAGQWQLTAGPKVYILTGRVRPYVTGQFGGSNQDSNNFHASDIIPIGKTAKNSLTFKVGGGVDYQLTPHVYWRVGQWAVQDAFWGRHSSSVFQNFSTGFGYQF